MTLKQLRELLNDTKLDESLEISIPDNTYQPTGIVPINNVTEVYNGLSQIVGYVIV